MEQLKDQMQPCVSRPLHAQLFHDDFKQHIAALGTLKEVCAVLCVHTHVCTLTVCMYVCEWEINIVHTFTNRRAQCAHTHTRTHTHTHY